MHKFTITLIIAGVLLLGIPLASWVTHGLDTRTWPVEAILPNEWFGWWLFPSPSNLSAILETFRLMATGQHIGFPSGGIWHAAAMGGAILGGVLLIPTSPANRRDPSDQLGGARWMNKREKRALSRGLELGRDLETGQLLRLPLEGNAISFAPPRSGKTTGLVMNNLAGAEANSWLGPAVIMDPKGEIYRAVAERRCALGREVYCLDPLGIAGGEDTWNPLAEGADPDDVLRIQRMCDALIGEVGEQNQYFSDSANDVLTGVIVAVLERDGQSSPDEVHRLFSSLEALQELAETSDAPAVLALRETLKSDPKTRDPLLSTARKAFRAFRDQRMIRVTSTSSVDLGAVARGQADLFIVVTPEDQKTLAPWLRWLFAELFTAVRRERLPEDERVIAFIDEAAILGRFEPLIDALGEIPGMGLSLWTFWQTRGHITRCYGQDGLGIFLGTAEVTTFAMQNMADRAATEELSATLGEYTARVPTEGTSGSGREARASQSETLQRTRLMTPDAIGSLPSNELICVLNAKTSARRSVRLRRVLPTEPRLQRVLNLNADGAPVAR